MGVVVVDVVGVFLNVNGQQWFCVGGQWGVGVVGGDDSQVVVGIFDQSGLVSVEVFCCGIGKFGFKICEVVERFGDCGCQFVFWFVVGVRCEVVLVEGVVLDLCCVVEYVVFRSVDDFFEGFVFECSVFDQVVEVSDICLVVFIVVIFQGFCGNVWCQGVFCIW